MHGSLLASYFLLRPRHFLRKYRVRFFLFFVFFLAQPGKDRIFFFSFNYCQPTAILLLLIIIKMPLSSNSFHVTQNKYKASPRHDGACPCIQPEHITRTQNAWEPLFSLPVSNIFLKGVTGRGPSPCFPVGVLCCRILCLLSPSSTSDDTHHSSATSLLGLLEGG